MANKNHLIVFTIGPVQSFISQARRTQDLYAGSRMLSSLTREAYLLFDQKLGAANHTLIFPAFYGQDNLPVQSNPNRFALSVSGLSNIDIQGICREVEKELRTNIFEKAALDSLTTIKGFQKVSNESQQQLSHHLEVYWAAIVLDSTNEYVEQYLEIEKYLAATKNLRPFQQNSEVGRKCNVDGIRNAIFVKPNSSSTGKTGRVPAFIQKNHCQLPATDTRLSPGEGLSAMSMYKRIYEKEGAFPSTARIALLAKLKEIEKDESKAKLLQEYKDLFSNNYWDEQLLYPENVSAKYFKRQGLTSCLNEEGGESKIKPEITNKYEELVQEVKSFSSSYYAIILFDGDKMGEWFHGGYLEDKNQLFDFQQSLRDLLQQYATWALEYLDEPRGKAIYAGGDDFLGLINLNHLFEAIKILRLKFDQMVNQPLKQERVKYKVLPEANFSFSAGIAIAHYKQPLNIVLNEARKAESEAKNKADPDQFCIKVIRHSGGTTTTILPFGTSQNRAADTGEENQLVGVNSLQGIYELLIQQDFSNQFITNLIHETRYWDGANPRELFDLEALRLTIRANNIVKGETESKEEFQARKEVLINLITGYIKELSHPSQAALKDEELKNTISALRICDFIYRATKNENDD